MKVLITGANGFLGTHLVEYGISQGHQIFAAHRKGADINYLKGLSCHTIELNYRSQNILSEELALLCQQEGQFDLIIHNAALTNTIHNKSFYQVNAGITEILIGAVITSKILSSDGKFSLISSMAALGPVGFNRPVSHYGKSKLQAESILKKSGLPYLIFRPTAIYGPRDNSFLPLFKAVKLGVYPLFNPLHQKITMIHGADVANNVLNISKDFKDKTIHLDDGQVYSHKDILGTSSTVMNKKARLIVLPWILVRPVFYLITGLARITGKTPAITAEKHFEISRDWNHNFLKERSTLPLQINFSLQGGFQNTYDHYKTTKQL